MKRYCLLLFTFFSIASYGQSVKDHYTERIFEENFDNNALQWPILTNKDNFYIIQNGEYFLKRSNEVSSYVLLNQSPAKWMDYKCEAEFKINQTNLKESALGIIFLIQDNGKDAFVIEVTDGKKYRIRQLNGDNYHLLTGEQADGGWVKSSALKTNGNYNKIKINVARNVADIYFNDKFLTTISDPSYKEGAIGLIIGPRTEASVTSLYVSVAPNPKSEDKQVPNIQGQGKTDSTDFYRNAFYSQKREIKSLQNDVLFYQTNVKLLEDEVKALSMKDDSLTDYISKSRKHQQHELPKESEAVKAPEVPASNTAPASGSNIIQDSSKKEPSKVIEESPDPYLQPKAWLPVDKNRSLNISSQPFPFISIQANTYKFTNKALADVDS